MLTSCFNTLLNRSVAVHASAVHAASQRVHGIVVALTVGCFVVKLELLLLRNGLLRDDLCEALETRCLQP